MDILAALRGRIDTYISDALQESASEIFRLAQQNASFDRTIVDNLSMTPVTKQDGIYQVDIVINTNPETGAPEAPAFEYGSGIHATRGETKRYIIRPKRAPMLVFPLSRWPDFEPGRTPVAPDKRGLFHLPSVMHPGVRPRPLLNAAVQKGLNSWKMRMLRVLSKSVREFLVNTSFEERNG